MKTIVKLALANLKSNRNKTMVCIIAISITAFLLTTLITQSTHMYYDNIKNIAKTFGTSHAWFTERSIEDYENLKARGDCDIVGATANIGCYRFNKNSLYIKYTDPILNQTKLLDTTLYEGRLPTKLNEIAINKTVVELLGYTPKIGEKITLNMEIQSTEKHLKHTFNIVGLTAGKEHDKARKIYFANVSEEFMKQILDDSQIKLMTFIKFNKNLNLQELHCKVNLVAKELGIKDNHYIKTNDFYINAINPDRNSILMLVVLILIVCISAILIIYNIFNISIINNIRAYGKLVAIGTTKRQIRSLVLFEGLMLSAIAVPIGILLGFFIDSTIISQLNNIKSSLTATQTLDIIIAIVCINLITVMVSVLSPMRKASKISPIEAIRYQELTKNNRKITTSYKNISIAKLAKINLKTSKKRSLITLISLTLSGIIFIVVSTIMSSTSPETVARHSFGSDFIIQLYDYKTTSKNSDKLLNNIQINNPLSDCLIEQLKAIEGLKKIRVDKQVLMEIKNAKDELEILKGYSADYIKDIDKSDIIKGNINVNDLNNDQIIISEFTASYNKLSVGDKLQVDIYDGKKTHSKELKIQAIAKNISFYITTDSYLTSLCETNTNGRVTVYIDRECDSDFDSDFDNFLTKVTNENNHLMLLKYSEHLSSIKKSMRDRTLIIYCFVFIIGVISLINFINTMVTSIIARKKDLSIMQAIGMSDKQLKSLLHKESSYHLLYSLVLTLGVGSILGYLLCKFLNNLIGTFHYVFPFINCILLVTFIFIGERLLVHYLNSSLQKSSLVDRIRFSE